MMSFDGGRQIPGRINTVPDLIICLLLLIQVIKGACMRLNASMKDQTSDFRRTMPAEVIQPHLWRVDSVDRAHHV
jgi:hypothetical protein